MIRQKRRSSSGTNKKAIARLRYQDRRGPKYGPGPAEQLEQLIREYGFNRVRDAVGELALQHADNSTTTSKRGRPTTIVEDMHLADWFYDKVEEYDQAGVKKPVQQAESDLCDLAWDGAGPYDRWQKLMKDRRLRGLRAWRAWARQVCDQQSTGRAREGSFPAWLSRFMK
jgi:hypothetical protein